MLIVAYLLWQDFFSLLQFLHVAHKERDKKAEQLNGRPTDRNRKNFTYIHTS
jgi:hypothetical protein